MRANAPWPAEGQSDFNLDEIGIEGAWVAALDLADIEDDYESADGGAFDRDLEWLAAGRQARRRTQPGIR